MLDELIAVLPEQRAARLREELALVRRGIERNFRDDEDKVRADRADAQGVGH